MTFTIGADPEIFVTKRGKPASAFGIIEGTKSSPVKVPGGAHQVDGMALEFNIDPVNYQNFEAFNRNIVSVMKSLKAAVPGHNFKIAATQEFGKEFMDLQPPEAKELGCDPDFNAYTLKENPRPDGERTFRTAAGHIHLGWGEGIPTENEEHREICASIVKWLDATVGLFMTYIDRDPLRRELYGKAGAFRPKPYGVEYRTPSNAWISSRDRRFMVFALIQKAISLLKNGRPPETLFGGKSFDDIADIINTGNHVMALYLLDTCLFSKGIFYAYSTMTAWENVKQNTTKLYGDATDIAA